MCGLITACRVNFTADRARWGAAEREPRRADRGAAQKSSLPHRAPVPHRVHVMRAGGHHTRPNNATRVSADATRYQPSSTTPTFPFRRSHPAGPAVRRRASWLFSRQYGRGLLRDLSGRPQESRFHALRYASDDCYHTLLLIICATGHLHCEKCLISHVEANSDAITASCPSCRTPFPIGEPVVVSNAPRTDAPRVGSNPRPSFCSGKISQVHSPECPTRVLRWPR